MFVSYLNCFLVERVKIYNYITMQYNRYLYDFYSFILVIAVINLKSQLVRHVIEV